MVNQSSKKPTGPQKQAQRTGQIQRFKDKAREIECDESEARFEKTLKQISTPKKEKPAA